MDTNIFVNVTDIMFVEKINNCHMMHEVKLLN